VADKHIDRDYGPDAELVFSLYDSAVGGHLAGGVAHHYNNLLGGMLGFVTLAPSLKRDELEGLCTRLQVQIEEAGRLTSTLLAMTRAGRGSVGNDVCDLRAKTAELLRLARACGGSSTEVRAELPDSETWTAIPELLYSRALLGLIVTELETLRATRSNGAITVALEVDDNVSIVTLTSDAAPPSDSVAEGTDRGPDAVRSLALVAARRIVDAAGGAVERTGEGEETRYVIRLPRLLAASAAGSGRRG
jgi:hypothetical protein